MLFIIKEFKEFDESQLSLYYECFSDSNWRYNYGVLVKEFDIDRYLYLITITKYESVRRFLLFERSRLIGFCHIQTCDPLSRRCIISGGVKPNFLRTGIGVYVACIIIDYIFTKLNMNKICCKVYSFNSTSFRLLSKIGFTLEGTAREHEYNEITGEFVDVHFFGLLYREYPNEFVQKILKRVKYEYAEE